MVKIRIKKIYFLRILRFILVITGFFFLSAFAVSFTSLPFWGIHWLGTSKSELIESPLNIIMLGGGGMPGESNLIRSWYTAIASEQFPEAKVIIAMPGDLKDSTSTPLLMQKELQLRGIKSNKIRFENTGTNTRYQALQCKYMLDIVSPVLIITSPEHMRRAVLCFKKVGFQSVNAFPAFENAAEADLTFTDDKLGGNKLLVPDVGNSISFRYQFWNHLKYEISIAREITALFYYKLRGWI